MRIEKIDSFINPLIESKKSFSWSQTNTSSIIDIPSENVQYNIIDTLTRKEVFYIHSKIKSNIKNSNIFIDSVPKENINYYSITNRLGINARFNNIFCIDIKSAYPSALLNEKLITIDTFNELQNFDKLERLKSIGMLASKKTILYYESGKLIDYELKESEFSNYFFYTQYVIGEIMQLIESELTNDFLFFWIDGIYFKNENNIKKVCEILERANYFYSIEKLEYITLIKNEKINVVLKPENKPEKKFTLPVFKNTFKVYQNKLLQTIKNK
jgi:hypothetical protein